MELNQAPRYSVIADVVMPARAIPHALVEYVRPGEALQMRSR